MKQSEQESTVAAALSESHCTCSERESRTQTLIFSDLSHATCTRDCAACSGALGVFILIVIGNVQPISCAAEASSDISGKTTETLNIDYVTGAEN